jgi:hypothetical protein
MAPSAKQITGFRVVDLSILVKKGQMLSVIFWIPGIQNVMLGNVGVQARDQTLDRLHR